MNISIFESTDNVYISYGVEIAFSTHGLGNIWLIAFVRTGQQCNQSSSNIHDGSFDKNREQVNLKTFLATILAKRLILDTWLGASEDWYIGY